MFRRHALIKKTTTIRACLQITCFVSCTSSYSVANYSRNRLLTSETKCRHTSLCIKETTRVLSAQLVTCKTTWSSEGRRKGGEDKIPKNGCKQECCLPRPLTAPFLWLGVRKRYLDTKLVETWKYGYFDRVRRRRLAINSTDRV